MQVEYRITMSPWPVIELIKIFYLFEEEVKSRNIGQLASIWLCLLISGNCNYLWNHKPLSLVPASRFSQYVFLEFCFQS